MFHLPLKLRSEGLQLSTKGAVCLLRQLRYGLHTELAQQGEELRHLACVDQRRTRAAQFLHGVALSRSGDRRSRGNSRRCSRLNRGGCNSAGSWRRLNRCRRVYDGSRRSRRGGEINVDNACVVDVVVVPSVLMADEFGLLADGTASGNPGISMVILISNMICLLNVLQIVDDLLPAFRNVQDVP